MRWGGRGGDGGAKCANGRHYPFWYGGGGPLDMSFSGGWGFCGTGFSGRFPLCW